MPQTNPTWDETEAPPSWDDTTPDLSKVGASPYDKYKLAVAEGATPENYAELPGITPRTNPDYDFPRQAGAVPFVGKAINAVQEHLIEPVAAQLFTQLKGATSVDVPPTEEQRGKGEAGYDMTPIEPGKPMLTLPKLTPQEMEAATPGERVAAGIGEGISGVYESFSTPGNALMLPLAEMKPVQAMYGAQMAMSIPDSLEQIAQAKTPDEIAKAYTSLTANIGLGTMLAHSAFKEAAPRTSEAPPAGTPGATPRPAPQFSLSPEHSKLLEPHMGEDGKGVFGKLEPGKIMLADHESGQIVVDPQEFAKFVDNDLKGMTDKQKAAAVKSKFDHEDLHLKTDPEDAEPFWNSMSPFEQAILKRQYLRGHDPAGFTAAQFGFEAIRNRMERAMGMTRDDFVGLALHERWTGKALDHLSNIVSKIRRLRDSELNTHQKGILDKVRANIDAAKDAIGAAAGVGAGNQPFATRKFRQQELDLDLSDMYWKPSFTTNVEPGAKPAKIGDDMHSELDWQQEYTRVHPNPDKLAKELHGITLDDDFLKSNYLENGVPEGMSEEGFSELIKDDIEGSDPDIRDGFPWVKEISEYIKENYPEVYAPISEARTPLLNNMQGFAIGHLVDLGDMDGTRANQVVTDPGEWGDVREDVPKGLRDFIDHNVFPNMEFTKVEEGPAARRKQDEIPDPPKGERVVIVRRQDGSIYRASFGGKYYDVSAGGKDIIDKYGGPQVASIGKLNERGEWSHGMLPKGDKIIRDYSPMARVERSGEGGPAALRNADYANEEARKLDEEAARLRAAGNHDDADELADMAKTLRQKASEDSFPAALRKKGKAGEQEEMFGAVTKKGVPGGEDVQPASAAFLGAKEVPPEQKVFAQDVWFEAPSESEDAQLPYRPISPSEAKHPEELKKILTSEARVGGSDLPVSMTRRLTALFDKRDGTVHLVSTYPGDGTVRMVDPALAGKERPSRPVEEITPNYEPFYSILLREPRQNFHQKFNSMADFQEMFHKDAKELAREHGTGYSGIPQGGDITSVDAPGVRESEVPQKGLRLSTPFSFPGEKYELPRPLEPELRAFHDFFGDTPPSDALQWARRIERTAATANRAMISGLRKLMRIVRAQHRGMSEGEALGNVLDQLYDNYKNSDTRSDFVQRTMAQSRPSTVEENAAAARRILAQAEREKRSGARTISTIRDRPPTESQLPPPEVVARGEGFEVQRPRQAPTPELPAPTPPEMLSESDRAKLDAEIEKEHPNQYVLKPEQVREWQVPKERYRVAGSNKPIEGGRVEEEAPEGSDALDEGDETPSHTNLEIFPERDVQSEAPKKPAGESLAQQKKVMAKAEGHKGQLDLFKKHDGPGALRRAERLREDAADAVNVLNAYVKRKASEQQLAASRDKVDTKYSVAGDQVDKEIRLVTADKKMPNGNKEVLKAAPTVVQAGAYTIDYPIPDALKGDVLVKMRADPIYRNIQNMFASPDAIDKAKAGQMLAKLKRETVLKMVDDGDIDWHTGKVKYNRRAEAQLEKFGKLLDKAEANSKNIIDSKGGGVQGALDRRAARARLKAVGDMREQLDYAQKHWNEPELQDTAAKMVVELEAQHRNERDMGMNVKRAENYLPGRYDEQWFDGDRIQFMEGPRILGRNFRKPATFNNYYEAIAAGNYLPFNMDGAALVAHRVRSGMRQIETRLWEKSLKTLTDPHSGMPMVASLKDGVSPSPEYVVHTFDGGRQMAVHKGSLDIIKALTGESIIQNSPATRRAMQISQKLKHTILFGDTFHLGRLKAYDWAINGIGKGGYRGGLSILEYRPESVAEAVRKGLVRPEDAAWAEQPIDVNLPRGGTTQVTRRQIGNMFLQRGLNAGRIADAIFKVEGGLIGKYNKFLFDKFTRGLMVETAVKEFERMNRQNPKVDYRKLVDDVARDTNNFMGSIGRQGWIKNQTFQDFFRMFGLAPQWVEGLIKKETALPGRLTGLSYLAGRRNVPLLGTAGRGIARGLATMFVVTQALNLITRRKPTWQNEEEGHKWDAWIPDATGKGEGFFVSPLSLFNEVTHDIIRLTGSKPTVYDAMHQIGENKLGPYGRAAMIFATGETPDHRKITSTGGMAKEVGKALIPVPISLGKVAQYGLSKVGIGQPPAPGSVQRQAMASLGVKTEPAPNANSQIYKKADEFVKENGLNRSTGWQQVQTDELGYSDLRRAVAAGDKKGFKEAIENLRKTRTDDQIYKAMQLWNARSFTGSKAAEKYFLSDLTDKELDLYSRARVERQQTLGKFEDMLIDDLTQSPAPSK